MPGKRQKPHHPATEKFLSEISIGALFDLKTGSMKELYQFLEQSGYSKRIINDPLKFMGYSQPAKFFKLGKEKVIAQLNQKWHLEIHENTTLLEIYNLIADKKDETEEEKEDTSSAEEVSIPITTTTTATENLGKRGKNESEFYSLSLVGLYEMKSADMGTTYGNISVSRFTVQRFFQILDCQPRDFFNSDLDEFVRKLQKKDSRINENTKLSQIKEWLPKPVKISQSKKRKRDTSSTTTETVAQEEMSEITIPSGLIEDVYKLSLAQLCEAKDVAFLNIAAYAEDFSMRSLTIENLQNAIKNTYSAIQNQDILSDFVAKLGYDIPDFMQTTVEEIVGKLKNINPNINGNSTLDTIRKYIDELSLSTITNTTTTVASEGINVKISIQEMPAERSQKKRQRQEFYNQSIKHLYEAKDRAAQAGEEKRIKNIYLYTDATSGKVVKDFLKFLGYTPTQFFMEKQLPDIVNDLQKMDNTITATSTLEHIKECVQLHRASIATTAAQVTPAQPQVTEAQPPVASTPTGPTPALVFPTPPIYTVGNRATYWTTPPTTPQQDAIQQNLPYDLSSERPQ